MVTFSLAHTDTQAAPAAFRVPARSVAFAGSRNGSVTPSVASRLVDGFLRLGFGFSTGCASGVDRCFCTTLAANRQAAEKTIIACAFPERARRFSVGEVFATTVVPPGLSVAAALHRRTVWMIRRCSLLVLVPDNPSTGRWGPGSRLATHRTLQSETGVPRYRNGTETGAVGAGAEG